VRIPVLVLSLAAALLLPCPARADSWAPPSTLVSTSADGRYVVLVTPERGVEARFVLLRRAAGAPPFEGDAPGPGDEVLARGTCPMPLAAYCLDAGRGFLLFETYASLGMGRVLARYDAKGRLLFSRGLGDLFQPPEIAGFRNSVSSVWWFTSHRYDPKTDALLVIYETPETVDPADPVRGPNVGPRRKPGLLRIGAEDGRVERGTDADLLPLIGMGTLDQRLEALEACDLARPAGFNATLRAAFADPTAPLALRTAVAARLADEDDARAKDLLLRTAKPGTEPRARALALEALARTGAAGGLDLLRAALREKDVDRAVGLAVWRGFAAYGAAAVDVLAAMVEERDAPEHYRNTAIGLLARLGADARPALPALERVAAEEGGPMADYARDAAEAIRRASAPR